MKILIGWLIPVVLLVAVWLVTARFQDWKRRAFYRSLAALLVWPVVFVIGADGRPVVANGWLLLVGNGPSVRFPYAASTVLFLAFGAIWAAILVPTKLERPERMSIYNGFSLLVVLFYGFFLSHSIVSSNRLEAVGLIEEPKMHVVEPIGELPANTQTLQPLKMQVVQSVPAVVLGEEIVQSHTEGKLLVRGLPGAMPNDVSAVLINQRTGDKYPIQQDAKGGFAIEIDVRTGDRIQAAWIPQEERGMFQAVPVQ